MVGAAMADKDKKKQRKHLPPRGDPKPAVVPARVPLVEEREDFGENTFAGALEAVKSVLEKAGTGPGAKGRKKG
jgi:hypothetical protein